MAYFNQVFVMNQLDKVKGIYYVYKGDKAYKEMKLHEAIVYYNKGLKLYPKHYGAWNNLGNMYVVYEDYFSALHAYSQAFKHNPKMMVARMNYGIIASEKMGNFDEALEQYQKVIETDRRLIKIPYVFNNKLSSKENRAIAYYNKGVTYRMKSLYANDDLEAQRKYLNKAIESYEKSIEIFPDSYDAQYNLGIIYHQIGDYDRAGLCYCKAISLAPMNYEAHYNMAVLLKKLKHYREAYEEIDKAVTLITASSESTAIQQYAAIVMNEITRDVYQNPEYRKYLERILAEEEAKLAEHGVKDEKDLKAKEKKKKGKKSDQLTASGMNMIGTSIVETEDLDQVILENFGACPSKHYFATNDDLE